MYAAFGTFNLYQGGGGVLERFLTPGEPRTLRLVLRWNWGRSPERGSRGGGASWLQAPISARSGGLAQRPDHAGEPAGHVAMPSVRARSGTSVFPRGRSPPARERPGTR